MLFLYICFKKLIVSNFEFIRGQIRVQDFDEISSRSSFQFFFIFPGCLGDNRTFFVGELKCQKPAGSCLKTWGRAKNSPLLKIGNYFSITRTPHLKCKNVPVNLVETNFCYAGINLPISRNFQTANKPLFFFQN